MKRQPQPDTAIPADAENLHRLRALLGVGFASLIGLTVLASTVAWLSHHSATKRMDVLLNVHSRIAKLSLEVSISTLEARHSDKNYLLNFKRLGFVQARAEYVSQVRNHVENIHKSITEIESLEPSETTRTTVAMINDAATAYETTFLAAVKLIEQRGYRNDGVIGKLREAIHAIENMTESHHLVQLQVDMLTIRRHEKDYLLRGDRMYVKRVHEAVARLNAHLTTATINADEERKMLASAKRYDQLFRELVEIDDSIATNIATYRNAASKILPPLETLLADAIAAEEATQIAMQQVSQRTKWTMVGTSLTATVIGIVIAVFLSRSIGTLHRRMLRETADRRDAASASAAKSEFLANMSHEIRTPMTAILGFADQLLEEGEIEKAPRQRINAINTIRRNGRCLLNLINDILDLSKIDAGKMAIERRDCQPCHVIAEAASLMRVQATAKGLSLNIEYIGAIPETIQTDPTRLRQILINLLGNAVKFTEVGAVRLVIRLVDDGDSPCLQFDVIDTGRGMTPEQVVKLFQPFTQADNSTTRKFGGTGLGLTISQRFAALLGGGITVVKTESGVGSTFRATVATGSLAGALMLDNPMSTIEVADTATTVARVAPSDLDGLRILLAEDGPDNQRLISFVLKKAGADVTVEENGKLALDAALAARDEGIPFDCILMDMQMPVMDGYEATGQLRRNGYTGPIIALTAHAMDGDRDKCIKAGCDDYATKPIERKKLIEAIQQRLVPAEAASTSAT